MEIEHLFIATDGIHNHLSNEGVAFFSSALFRLTRRPDSPIRFWLDQSDVEEWVDENEENYAITLWFNLGGETPDVDGSPEKAIMYLYHRFLVWMQNEIARESSISYNEVVHFCDPDIQYYL